MTNRSGRRRFRTRASATSARRSLSARTVSLDVVLLPADSAAVPRVFESEVAAEVDRGKSSKAGDFERLLFAEQVDVACCSGRSHPYQKSHWLGGVNTVGDEGVRLVYADDQ